MPILSGHATLEANTLTYLAQPLSLKRVLRCCDQNKSNAKTNVLSDFYPILFSNVFGACDEYLVNTFTYFVKPSQRSYRIDVLNT
jgi:hypothetical protein